MKNKRSDGFTLIEALIVVAIVSILAVVTLPQLRDFIAARNFKNSVRDIVSDINEMRSRAVARTRVMQIEFTTATPGTYVIRECQDQSVPCAGFNIIATKVDNNISFDSTPTITFQPRGTANPTGLVVSHGGASSTINVSITGRTGVHYAN